MAEGENMAIKGEHFHSAAVMSLLKHFLLPSPFTDAAISPLFLDASSALDKYVTKYVGYWQDAEHFISTSANIF